MDDCKWSFEKNLLSFQKANGSKRSSQQYLFPKTTIPRKKIKAVSTHSSLGKLAVLKVTLENANVYNCSFKRFTILNE